jgi:antitoxin HigA-1
MTIRRSDVGTTKFGNILSGRRLAAVHPGDVLLKEFIEPLGLTRYRVAKSIGVAQRRLDEICSGKRAVTADTAIRLGRFFSVEPQLWMNLQAQYDLEAAEQRLGPTVRSNIIPLRRAA